MELDILVESVNRYHKGNRLMRTATSGLDFSSIYKKMVEAIEEFGWSVQVVPSKLMHTGGSCIFTSQTIIHSDNLEGVALLDTMAHEMVHMVLHTWDLSSSYVREIEAEAGAWLLLHRLGINTTGTATVYICERSKTSLTLRKRRKRIEMVALMILDGIQSGSKMKYIIKDESGDIGFVDQFPSVV